MNLDTQNPLGGISHLGDCCGLGVHCSSRNRSSSNVILLKYLGHLTHRRQNIRGCLLHGHLTDDSKKRHGYLPGCHGNNQSQLAVAHWKLRHLAVVSPSKTNKKPPPDKLSHLDECYAAARGTHEAWPAWGAVRRGRRLAVALRVVAGDAVFSPIAWRRKWVDRGRGAHVWLRGGDTWARGTHRFPSGL